MDTGFRDGTPLAVSRLVSALFNPIECVAFLFEPDDVGDETACDSEDLPSNHGFALVLVDKTKDDESDEDLVPLYVQVGDARRCASELSALVPLKDLLLALTRRRLRARWTPGDVRREKFGNCVQVR